MNCKSLSSLLFASVFAIASLLLGASQAVAQTTPPMLVQVPWISMAAGGLSAGASVTALPATCTTGFVNTSATAYGDGCAYNNIWINTSYGVAADKWGNLYFSDTGHKYVRVVYAGDTVKVNGVTVTNPAQAMILAANAGTTQAAAIAANVSTTYPSGLVAGNVYAIAGGYTGAITVSGTSYYCNKTSGITGTNSSGSGCPATESYLNSPYGLAVDSDGSLFIADHGNSNIYVVPANNSGLAAGLAAVENGITTASISPGYIYVVAGKGGGYTDGSLATAGQIHAPWNVAVDSSENLYISDYTSNAVRMVNGPNNSTSGGVGKGYIHTIAGSTTCTTTCTALATTPSSNVAALGAAFLAPTGIAVDSYGNVFVGDGGSGTSGVPSTVRVIYAGGTYNPVASLIAAETGLTASSLTANYVYTIAGNGGAITAKSGSAALGNGSLATAATVGFYKIQGLALDASGNIYIVDYSSRGLIAEVNASTGILTFIVGDDLSSAGGAVGNYCFSGTTAAVGGTGPTMTDVYGDGCPAPNSNQYHSGGNPAFDTAGNMYMTNNIASGSTGGLIHKLTFTGAFPQTAVNSATPTTQTFAYELVTAASSGTTGYTASNVAVTAVTQGTNLAAANADFVLGTDTCSPSTTTLTGFPITSTGSSGSYAAGATTTQVCTIPVTFTPKAAGVRTGAVNVTATINGTAVTMTPTILGGVGNGAALAIDPATANTTSYVATSSVTGVTTDAAGNVYIAQSNGTVFSSPSGTLSTPIAGALTAPRQMAVDGAGDVFVADAGASKVLEFVPGSTTPIVVASHSSIGLSIPQGVAVDAAGNLYIADRSASLVFFLPHNNGVVSLLGSSAGFIAPTSVAVDTSGNVYVADIGSASTPATGQGFIVKIPAGNGTPTTLVSNINPVAVAVDAAGNVYYADSVALDVVEIPVSGTATTLVTGLTTPVGLALDQNGGLYVADNSKAYVSYYSRQTSSQNFVSQGSTVTATLTNVGNLTYTNSSSSQTNSVDFTIGSASSNGCGTIGSFSLIAGKNCGLSATMNPSKNGTLTDTLTLIGNSLNGSPTMTVTGTATSIPYVTTAAVSGLNPTAPVYGGSVQVTATISCSSTTTATCTASNIPTGTVIFSVDGTPQTSSYTLNSNGQYTVTLSGLTATSHSVTVAFTPGSGSNGSFAGSNSTASPLNFTVAPLPITATVSTLASALQMTYGNSAPSIAGYLTGVLSGDTANVAVTFATTANSTQPVNATAYPISATLSGTARTNYSVTVNANPGVTITQRPVTLAVSSTSIVYGSAIPTFTGTFTNLVNSDTVTATYSTNAVQYSPVVSGGYVITAGTTLGGTGGGNYSLAASAITNGTLTVTAKPITATVAGTPISIVYGTAVPALNGTLSGVVNSDAVTPVFTTTATSTSPISSTTVTYPISVTLTGAAKGNYTVTMATATNVAITKAPLSVYVNNATCEYGGLTVNTSGNANGCISGGITTLFGGSVTGIVGSDNVTVSYNSTTATATSSVNTAGYPITASTTLGGTMAGNYSLASSAITNGALSITQAVASFVSLTTSQSSAGEGSPVTITATMTSDTGALPIGSVVLSYINTNNGVVSTSTTLPAIPLNGGVAQLLGVTTLPTGTLTFTATYAGSTNFSVATPATVAETITVPVVTGTASSSSLTITSGSTGSVGLTTTALGGYTGTATYSCEVLPANMSCSFSPASSTFTSTTTTATTTLTISTKAGGTTTTALLTPEHRQGGTGSMLIYAALLVPFGLLGLVKGRKSWRMLTMMVLFVIGLAAMAGVSGCGSTSKATTTPAGTYTIEVEITAGAIQVVPITVIVK